MTKLQSDPRCEECEWVDVGTFSAPDLVARGEPCDVHRLPLDRPSGPGQTDQGGH